MDTLDVAAEFGGTHGCISSGIVYDGKEDSPSQEKSSPKPVQQQDTSQPQEEQPAEEKDVPAVQEAAGRKRRRGVRRDTKAVQKRVGPKAASRRGSISVASAVASKRRRAAGAVFSSPLVMDMRTRPRPKESLASQKVFRPMSEERRAESRDESFSDMDLSLESSLSEDYQIDSEDDAPPVKRVRELPRANADAADRRPRGRRGRRAKKQTEAPAREAGC